jgi:protein involved in polysaccharide export with SLBB domain
MHRTFPGRLGSTANRGPTTHGLWLVACSLLSAALGGCAALTNPVADGVPVRLLAPELLARSKNDEHTIALNLLRQPPSPTYRLAPGDVLGMFIEGVLGDPNQPVPLHTTPPVQIQNQRRLPPAVGFPVPVEDNGTIVLPQVGPVRVQGLSLSEAREAVRRLYLDKEILKPNKDRVLVTLLQPRQYHVLVLRQEAATFAASPEGVISASKRGTGFLVDLPAYENDVLHALAQTGGLPGLDACNAIVIHRDCFKNPADRAVLVQQIETLAPGCRPVPATGWDSQTVRIPLRLPHGEKLPIPWEDVILRTGDVVFLESREREVFYTGGLLPPGEYILPRDRDLDVLEAVSRVKGPLFNGAFAVSNLSGALISPGIGNPSPSLLVVVRRTPHGGTVPIVVDLRQAMCDPRERILVQAGDVLLLQEKPGEALARYFTQTFFNFNMVWEVFHSRFASGVVDVSAPDRLPGRLGVVDFNGLPR